MCLLIVLLFHLGSCGGGPENSKDAANDGSQENNTASNFTVKVSAISVLPDRSRLAVALRDDVEAKVVDDLLSKNEQMRKNPPPASAPDAVFTPKNDPENLKAFMAELSGTFAKPGQTVVQVHAATTEQIIAYEKGTTAFEEFPGGSRRVAEKILRPGMTFYEVEYLKPGEDLGMKYHMFYWDGKQWSMLGPAWRVLPSE